MKMRLTGTRPECDRFVAALLGATVPGVVREVSGFYPNHGTSQLGRVYLDLELPTYPGEVDSAAASVDVRPGGRAGRRAGGAA